MSQTLQRSRSQSEDAYGFLRAALLSCEIAPSAKILIATVCEQLGFSSGSVREALSRLSAEGLVVAEPQKGFRAAPISAEDLRDLTTTRAEIEALCIAGAVARGDVAWEGRVLASHHRLSRIPMTVENDPKRVSEGWSEAHADFHAALAEGCGGAWLIRIRRMLYEQSERYRRLSVPLDEGHRDIEAEHRAICDAAIGRHSERAVRLLREHIEATTRIILDGLQAKRVGDRTAI